MPACYIGIVIITPPNDTIVKVSIYTNCNASNIPKSGTSSGILTVYSKCV